MPNADRLSSATDRVVSGRQPLILNVPGLGNSGPTHWQSRWEARYPWFRRADLGSWDAPDRESWTQRLDQTVRAAGGPVILVAHSLGCIAVAWWAAIHSPAYRQAVAGALLVAPADADHGAGLLARFAPVPMLPLPFPSILVASRNDPYSSFDRSAAFARMWGSHLVDAGHAGHLNAESGLGDWPLGVTLIDSLADAASLTEEADIRLATSARFHSVPPQQEAPRPD